MFTEIPKILWEMIHIQPYHPQEPGLVCKLKVKVQMAEKRFAHNRFAERFDTTGFSVYWTFRIFS